MPAHSPKLQKAAGIQVTFVAYSSPGNARTDLSEGRLHVALMPMAEVVEMAHANKLRLLAVTNPEHGPAAPEAAAEEGFPSLTFGGPRHVRD